MYATLCRTVNPNVAKFDVKGCEAAPYYPLQSRIFRGVRIGSDKGHTYDSYKVVKELYLSHLTKLNSSFLLLNYLLRSSLIGVSLRAGELRSSWVSGALIKKKTPNRSSGLSSRMKLMPHPLL